MRVWVNDKPVELGREKTTLTQMVNEKGITTDGCAIAINGTILPRSKWGDTTLNEGDQVSLFQAIAGG